MKAMTIAKFGDINVFEETTLPKPTLIPGHVLVKIKATSVNPLDFKMRLGYFPDLVPAFPMVLHGDLAGIVEEVGAGVEGFAVGDEVYGCAGGLLEMGGALAEYMVVDARLIAHKPKTLSFAQAAALPLVALTAWEAFVSYADVQKDQTVLIHGATGGVGHVAIQLAKYLGARVYATSSSPQKMAIAKKLGADVVINYRETDVQTYVTECTDNKGFDIVFDTVGGDNLPNCFTAAAAGGQVISILSAGQYDLTPAFLKGLTLHNVFQPLPLLTGLNRQHYQDILVNIAKLVDDGLIKPLVDEKQFAIKNVGAAHAHAEKGNAIGKVVLLHA